MSDISYILRNERSQIKSNFQEQLTATLSHEQLTPLNSIINLSDIQTKRFQNEYAADSKIQCNNCLNYFATNKQIGGQPSLMFAKDCLCSQQLKENLKKNKQGLSWEQIIWSSAKLMQYLIESQISNKKISNKRLTLNYIPWSGAQSGKSLSKVL
jgi:signal transduction histidine kinase